MGRMCVGFEAEKISAVQLLPTAFLAPARWLVPEGEHALNQGRMQQWVFRL